MVKYFSFCSKFINIFLGFLYRVSSLIYFFKFCFLDCIFLNFIFNFRIQRYIVFFYFMQLMIRSFAFSCSLLVRCLFNKKSLSFPVLVLLIFFELVLNNFHTFLNFFRHLIEIISMIIFFE